MGSELIAGRSAPQRRAGRPSGTLKRDRTGASGAALGIDHQRLWKQWLDKQLGKAANDKTGRKDFLTRLTAFVR